MERGSANNLQYVTIEIQELSMHRNPETHPIVINQIHYLTDKIKALEHQTDCLTYLKNQSAMTNKNSVSQVDASASHSTEILMAIEKKIQIIVRETRKIVDKLGETFEKKLQTRLSQKINEASIDKMQDNYSKSLRNIENNYKKEIDKLSKQHKETENRMLARVTTIEQQMTNKINEFEIKEKEYVDWIHHLEIQLQKKPEQKKKIDLTYIAQAQDKFAKKEQTDSSILTGGDNHSVHKMASQISENSKVQRRHRIFEPVGAPKSSDSVSPNNTNNRVVSPLSGHPKNAPSSTKNIQIVPKPHQPESNFQFQKPNFVLDRMTEPMKIKGQVQKEASPWKVMDKSAERSQGEVTRRNNQIVKDVNEDQFYKDIPKAGQGWQKFQNYQQVDESSSGSEQDIVFYGHQDKSNTNGWSSKENNWNPASKQSQRPEIVDQSGGSKLFSPFDLN